MVFRGTFKYSLDNRGRIPLPARFRASFGNGVVLVENREGCVQVYSADAYEKEAEFLLNQPPNRRKVRLLRRGFFANSFDADIDGQGRILLPPHLRQHGDLNGQVVVVGCGGYLEIWSPQRWAAQQQEIDARYDADLESMEERP
ncbi:MAG: division/cell wall cluster transcriptional repressor MraZ [Dehalococcoidia bacterium]|jgi:MraZ protein